MIPQSIFVEKMQEQWSSFGNIPSPALLQAWKQQCEVFTETIRLSWQARQFDGIEDQETMWKILQPPTGSGKTLGTIVYAALMNLPGSRDHPGALIVTRLKQDADLICREDQPVVQDV